MNEDKTEKESSRPKGTKRLTLDIPIELHGQLKILAAKKGCSMKEVAEQWIRDGVQAENRPRK
jgi:predicted HicB family RNase H-like nuclease